MLKKLKKKDDKKQGKKKTEVVETKEPEKAEQQVEQEESTDLVDAEELKQEQNKVKQNNRKKNDYQLEEKVIDVSNINLAKNEKPKVITSWKVNTVQEVMKEDFKMENIDHEFTSLTDEKLNEELMIKKKQEELKKKNSNITFQNNLRVQTIEKSQDQLKMEKADNAFQFSQSATNGEISTSASAAKMFTNSGSGFTLPIEKSAQQIRMEEMEKKQQEMAANQKPTTWLSAKRNDIAVEQKPTITLKTSAWVTMATENQNSDVGANLKFAPINAVEEKEPVARPQETKKPETKANPWVANSVQEVNGMKFAPLQASKQDVKMMQSERKEQEFVFVSKKDMEERKKKREQKELLMKGKEQPKV